MFLTLSAANIFEINDKLSICGMEDILVQIL